MGIGGLILFFSMTLCIAQNPASPETSASGATKSSAANAAPVAILTRESAEKSRREKAIADAAELSAVANQLRDQLHEVNVNVFPLGVVQKTEVIERLVRKIKEEGHDH